MKEVIYPVLAFAVILIIGCTNSKKADVKNPPVGAWEHMSTTFLIHYFNGEKHDTTIVVPATDHCKFIDSEINSPLISSIIEG